MKHFHIKRFFVGPVRSAIWGCFFLFILSAGIFVIASYASSKETEIKLLRDLTKIQDQINNRFQVYANSLLAIRSYIYNQRELDVDRSDYIQDMQLFDRYPGLKAVGTAEVIPQTDLSAQALRLSQKIPNFSLDPYSFNTDYHAIVTGIYPFDDADNQKALGFDMMSEINRKRAIMLSVYTDRPLLSGHVKLMQDKEEEKTTGVLLFLPVYMEKGPRQEKSIQNTKNILFMSLRSADLFNELFGTQSLSKEKVGFSIEILSNTGQTTRIYDRFEEIKKMPKGALRKKFDLFGQNFQLTVYPLKNFYSPYDILFPYILSLLTLLICALIFLNIRNNAVFATDLSKTNKLLNETLLEQEEKQEDLFILNRTLQRMSHLLDVEKITESFIMGVSEIFESKGKFAIYSTAKPTNDSIKCHLISCNDDAFFISDCKLNMKTYGQLFNTREPGNESDTIECGFLVINPKKAYIGLFAKIDTFAFGTNAFAVFIGTSGVIDEAESVLFKALTKHLNTCLQNALLLKKVEDSNQSKTAFLANMSHEIRTPLNALMGFSEILIREDITPKMKFNLSTNIIKNGKQLSRLVDDILDLSKIEAGKFLIEKKRINLFELLSELKSVMQMRIIDNRIELKMEMDGKLPQFIEMDPLRLKQILSNLIGNSIKFTEKGFVRLRISYEPGEGGKSTLIFKVEDTGTGIDRDFRNRLFLPFSQADSTATRKYSGTGLGLAISKRLAQELGGQLALVFSEKDIGSVFELKIPINEVSDPAFTDTLSLVDEEDKVPEIPEEILKNKKILLVEDSPDNQDFFQFFLGRAGAQVKIVSNGLDAVDEAEKTMYDIILMDIQIPGIDGKEATKRIRKKGFNGPIVALTAHAMEEEQKSCINAGCSGQISKPVSGQVLVTQVSAFLNPNIDHHAATI